MAIVSWRQSGREMPRALLSCKVARPFRTLHPASELCDASWQGDGSRFSNAEISRAAYASSVFCRARVRALLDMICRSSGWRSSVSIRSTIAAALRIGTMNPCSPASMMLPVFGVTMIGKPLARAS